MLRSRKLGSQGLNVSAMGLGCMGMSRAYGEANESESIATIHHAIDQGVTLFDAAETYVATADAVSGRGEALRG